MLSIPQVLVRLEGLWELKMFNNRIGSQTRDFPACSIAPAYISYFGKKKKGR
jgi:hypothetical protein